MTTMLKRATVLGVLAIAVGTFASTASASASPARIASVIERVLLWAVEGRDLPAEPPKPTPALPHRDCGGKLDREHLPAVVYVSWQISGEGQQAACNWKYDVASRKASPLSAAEAGDVERRISEGTLGPQERAFFHAVPQRDGRLRVTAGYCWGSATGTFAFKADEPLLTGELTVRGY